MATSTTSDPLPSRTLPSHPAYPSDASPAAPFVRHDAYEQGQTSRSNEVVKEDLKGKGKGKERAIDLRGFAAGTASGLTKLVVGASLSSSSTRDEVLRKDYSGDRSPIRRDQGPTTMFAARDVRRAVGVSEDDYSGGRAAGVV